MKIFRFNKEIGGETAKNLVISLRKRRLLFVMAETNWHTKGKNRRIPIWRDGNSFFCYRFAARIYQKA